MAVFLIDSAWSFLYITPPGHYTLNPEPYSAAATLPACLILCHHVNHRIILSKGLASAAVFDLLHDINKEKCPQAC